MLYTLINWLRLHTLEWECLMTHSHFSLALKGQNADPIRGGTSAQPATTGRQNRTPHQTGWVRGYHKDGGGYAKEMPKLITGKI